MTTKDRVLWFDYFVSIMKLKKKIIIISFTNYTHLLQTNKQKQICVQNKKILMYQIQHPSTFKKQQLNFKRKLENRTKSQKPEPRAKFKYKVGHKQPRR